MEPRANRTPEPKTGLRRLAGFAFGDAIWRLGPIGGRVATAIEDGLVDCACRDPLDPVSLPHRVTELLAQFSLLFVMTDLLACQLPKQHSGLIE